MEESVVSGSFIGVYIVDHTGEGLVVYRARVNVGASGSELGGMGEVCSGWQVELDEVVLSTRRVRSVGGRGLSSGAVYFTDFESVRVWVLGSADAWFSQYREMYERVGRIMEGDMVVGMREMYEVGGLIRSLEMVLVSMEGSG